MTRRRHIGSARPGRTGFTLVELMVVVAIVAIVLVLAAPSFRDLIEMRRLRGAVAQLVTDVQFARSEAASRQEAVGVSFNPAAASGGMSCYTIYTVGTAAAGAVTCDCTAAPGARCSAPLREIRTLQLDAATALRMVPVGVSGNPPTPLFTFDPATGAITAYDEITIVVSAPQPNTEVWVRTSLTSPGATRALMTVINPAGRPKNCVPSGSVVGGMPAC